MKAKIIYSFILFIILFNSFSFSFYSSLPIWQDYDTLQTNSQSVSNFISLESESAILIEQTTRRNSF